MSRSIDLRRDDSDVRCWDAVNRGDAGAAAAASPQSFAVIQQLRARDDVFEPNAEFLDRLEYALVAASPRMPQPVESWPALASTPRSSVKPDSKSLGRGSWFGHRWAPVAIALALLLVLLTAIPLAIQQSSEPPAIPAAIIPAATMETMAQLDFTPPFWDMPDGATWNHMEINLFRIDPGSSFATDPSYNGPFMLMVLNGELSIQTAGPALLYSAGHSDAPAQILAGTETKLKPDDTIVYSTADGATGRNPGTEPVFAVFSLTGQSRDVSGEDTLPSDVTQIDLRYIDHASLIDTKAATVTLRRAELQPLDSFVFAPGPDWKYVPTADVSYIDRLTIAAGAFDSWSPDIKDQPVSSSAALMLVKPATYTLFNLGDKPIDLYFLVVQPYPAMDATPAPE